MIIVVGSRHDDVARSLVAALPTAALCGADDLTRPGWVWPLASPELARWVVEGEVVDDREVTGVLVRRTYVYPEELVTTHADDREYLAAEATAFLVFVLSQTRARVVNPVGDGALGDDVVRPERWMRAATGLGLRVVPLRLRSDRTAPVPAFTTIAEVVGESVFGDAPPSLRESSIALAKTLGLTYGALVFDRSGRLVTLSAMKAPSAEAVGALASVLRDGL